MINDILKFINNKKNKLLKLLYILKLILKIKIKLKKKIKA